VPILGLGGVLLYIQSNQSEILQREIAKLNEEHKGIIRVGASELSLWGNFPDISIKVLWMLKTYTLVLAYGIL